MHKTLVQKINDIDITVLSEGTSLDVSYNYQEVNKVGAPSGQSNTSGVIPLGKASATLAFSFYPSDLKDNNALFSDIIENQGKELKIEDIYLGTLYGYLLSSKVTHSQRDVNRPIYNIKVNLTSGEWASTLNIKSDVANLNELEKDKLLSDIIAFKNQLINANNPITEILKENILDPASELTVSVKTIVANGGRAFFDDAFNLMFSSLGTAFLATSVATDVLERTRQTTNSINSLIDSFKQLKQFPEDFNDLLIKTIENVVSILKPNRSKPIYKPIINNKEISNGQFADLGNIAKDTLATQVGVCLILNRIALLMDLRKLLLGGFKNREELRALVNNILNRYDYLGYEEDTIYKYKAKIKEYSMSLNLSNLRSIYVEVPKPLLRIVYDLYGSLDYYDEIININNIKDPENVEGGLLVI